MQQWKAEKPYIKVGGNLLEGPFYDAKKDEARFIDIKERYIYSFSPGKGPESLKRVRTDDILGVTANIKGRKDLIVGAKYGFAKMDPETGKVEYLKKVATWDDKAKDEKLRSNDGAVDSRGGFWVGTMNDAAQWDKEGSFYRLDPDLSVHLMLTGVGAPNGMGWSPDEKIMYWTDSEDHVIYGFDFDVEKGSIGVGVDEDKGKKAFYRVDEEDWFPDGAVVDEEGCVWTAIWGGHRVLRISPEGKRIGEVLLPTKYVTCPEFIGTKLLITTRRDPEIQEDCAERGGDVYLVDVGVTGPQKHEFHFAT
ncbi:hypothetical protein BDZ45DRAFT_673659 [Acephala macrosclerotiorum]|nr:hypothetical protein BDZ45DRAFT_673659 [Acephala macrosclerotiorum]